MNDNNRYLNERQVSELTGLALPTLRNDRSGKRAIALHQSRQSCEVFFTGRCDIHGGSQDCNRGVMKRHAAKIATPGRQPGGMD